MLYAQGGKVSYTPFIPKTSPSMSGLFDIPIVVPTRPSVSVVNQGVYVNRAIIISDDMYLHDVQVKVTEYSNRDVQCEVIGIKNNNKWIPMESPLTYIPELLSESNIPPDVKTFFLKCNEYANYIAIYKDGYLLVGLKDNALFK